MPIPQRNVIDLDKMWIKRAFSYHKPFGDQPDRYEKIRAKARELGDVILDNAPESTERAEAIRNLQQTVMWANASIAINEKDNRELVL
jgi:hypothetical protein